MSLTENKGEATLSGALFRGRHIHPIKDACLSLGRRTLSRIQHHQQMLQNAQVANDALFAGLEADRSLIPIDQRSPIITNPTAEQMKTLRSEIRSLGF